MTDHFSKETRQAMTQHDMTNQLLPPRVGQKVNARIDLISDLTDEGMGRSLCAARGEELVVRAVKDSGWIYVSHEHVTDRSFSVRMNEIDYPYLTDEVQP